MQNSVLDRQFHITIKRQSLEAIARVYYAVYYAKLNRLEAPFVD